MHRKRRQGYGDDNVAHTTRDGDGFAVPTGFVRQAVIKPTVTLFLFALASVFLSWTCALSQLESIILPLVLALIGLLLGGRALSVNGWPLSLLSGALVSVLWATHFASARLDAGLAGSDLDVSGYVASLPLSDGALTRFEFAVTSGLPAGKVRLSWRDAPQLQVGQHWQLTVKLRRPHGFASPGALDFEAWALRQGIVATGYVKAGHWLGEDNIPWFLSVHRLRELLKEWLDQTASKDNQGLLMALLLGDKSRLTPAQWQVFNATGTTHLMVISGLHIGLMAWSGFMLASLLARAGILPLRRLPLPMVRASSAMLLAGGYAALAGFGIPVQRALVMTFTAMLSPLLGIRPGAMTLWLLALAVVLLFDPLAITSAGFWYSFITVAALLLGMAGRFGSRRWLSKMFKPQWLVFLLLAPLLLFHGQPVSPLSVLVNLVAIPVIGLAVAPPLLFAALLHFFCPQLAAWLIQAVDYLLTIFQWGLRWMAGLMVLIPPRQSVSWLTLVLAVLGMLFLIAPASLRLRALAPALLMPLLFPQLSVTPQGEAEVAVLDVGQGLSVLIKTRQHLLVYDTGDRFSERMTAAQSVILPALSALGAQRVDRIMISHGDRDHAGGLSVLLVEYPGAEVISGTQLPDYDGPWSNCRAGDQWQWDGVYFQVLSGGGYRRRNDSSCVLKVTAGSQSLLLPGDISERVERDLLAQRDDLQATVLVAAHHGSRFSSSADFLAAVQPETILFSAGFANRFGHPMPQVLERAATVEAEVLNTAVDGSVFLTLGRGHLNISAYRKTHARYWWQ